MRQTYNRFLFDRNKKSKQNNMQYKLGKNKKLHIIQKEDIRHILEEQEKILEEQKKFLEKQIKIPKGKKKIKITI